MRFNVLRNARRISRSVASPGSPRSWSGEPGLAAGRFGSSERGGVGVAFPLPEPRASTRGRCRGGRVCGVGPPRRRRAASMKAVTRSPWRRHQAAARSRRSGSPAAMMRSSQPGSSRPSRGYSRPRPRRSSRTPFSAPQPEQRNDWNGPPSAPDRVRSTDSTRRRAGRTLSPQDQQAGVEPGSTGTRVLPMRFPTRERRPDLESSLSRGHAATGSTAPLGTESQVSTDEDTRTRELITVGDGSIRCGHREQAEPDWHRFREAMSPADRDGLG